MDLKSVQQIQTKLLGLCPLRDSKDLVQEWEKLDTLMNEMRTLTDQIRLIHQSTKKAIVQKIKKFRNSIHLLEKQDIQVSDLKSLKFNERELAPQLSLPVVEVPSDKFIPDTPLYYIQNTGEWGVKIMGVVISGSVGEITQQGKKHIDCRRANCKGCPRRHAGEPIGWLSSHWVHAKKPLCPKNANMRHFGTRKTLRSDILISSTEEIRLRNKQLAHDLLVMLLANKLKNT